MELLLDRWMDGCLLYKFDSSTKKKKRLIIHFVIKNFFKDFSQ